MKTSLTILLLLVGFGNAAPLIGVLGAERLASMYGTTLTDPDLLLLMQHRAVLFGLLGGFIMVSAFVPALRNAAFAAGFISMVSFLVLAWLTGTHGAAVLKLVRADMMLLALFVAALAIHFRQPGLTPSV